MDEQFNSIDSPADAGPIPSRMRFEDPVKFLEFYEKQLARGVVGLRHPQPIVVGTAFLVVISPPGAPDQLRLPGRVSRVRQRTDGAWRLRIEVHQRPDDAAWLEGYVTGLRVAVAWSAMKAPTAPTPLTSAPPQVIASQPAIPEPPPRPREASPGEVRALALKLDELDYFALLSVPRTVGADDLQTRFHLLTRRFHPDLFHGLDRRLVQDINRIYRRMNEAYSVLKSPMRRKAYVAGLDSSAHEGRLRIGEEALDLARRQETTTGGITRPGDFYWARARSLLESARGRQEWLIPARQEAARLLRTAAFFEPDNQHFRHALEHVVSQLPRR